MKKIEMFQNFCTTFLIQWELLELHYLLQAFEFSLKDVRECKSLLRVCHFQEYIFSSVSNQQHANIFEISLVM